MDQQLEVFVTVAERKNFSRAAEELHMTQPAVSQYIRALENRIGTRLLERSNKYVRLNKAGEIVYHHAQEILGLYTKMQNLVDDLTNRAKGPLLIGASYTFGEYILPHIIAKMHEQYPLIRPEITIGNTKEIAELVMNHQIEVGIVEGDFKSDKLLIEPFAEDSMIIFTSAKHQFAKKNEEITVAELVKERWIVREEGSGTREAAENMFHKLGFSPQEMMIFGSTQLIKESVEAGVGVSMLSRWAIRKELLMGTLKEVTIKGLPFIREFSIVTQTPFQTKALEVFLDLIRKNKQLTNLLVE